MNLTDLTIAEAAPLLRDRQISPVELTRAYLERIERLNPLLNAYITVTAELALDAARTAESDIARGEYRGMLHGIPIALKDNIETAGVRTTAGSSFLRDYVPTKDSEVVKQLKAAGAILLGKTNMHEWAFGVINNNPWYGDTRNPWDTARITGGSSGGSAAAVAAKLCMAALGTDTRGSVRIPAALCGVVGVKPAKDLISTFGVIPLSRTLDCVGVLARTVSDAHIVGSALYSNPFAEAFERFFRKFEKKHPRRIRERHASIARDSFTGNVAPSIAKLLEDVRGWLTSAGIECEDADLSGLEALWGATRVISSSEAAEYHEARVAANPDGFGVDVLPRLQEGLRYSAIDYIRALRWSDGSDGRDPFGRFSEFNDLLVLPTLPMSAPRHDDAAAIADARLRFSGFNAPFNLLSMVSCVSVPLALDDNGLPIGLQLAYDPLHIRDEQIVSIAQHLQASAGWSGRLPEL
jgi:aspartyl-tRNA(Asn)/glutamyl-tRNA(Gln) amidotransferase subunit A